MTEPFKKSHEDYVYLSDRIDARIAAVRKVLRRVLRKYPYNTLPPEMTWLITQPDAQRSIITKDLVVPVSAMRNHPDTRPSFPVSLLNMAEQGIAAWARTRYWAHANAKRDAERKAQQERIAMRQRRVERLQQQLEAAQRDLERLTRRATS